MKKKLAILSIVCSMNSLAFAQSFNDVDALTSHINATTKSAIQSIQAENNSDELLEHADFDQKRKELLMRAESSINNFGETIKEKILPRFSYFKKAYSSRISGSYTEVEMNELKTSIYTQFKSEERQLSAIYQNELRNLFRAAGRIPFKVLELNSTESIVLNVDDSYIDNFPRDYSLWQKDDVPKNIGLFTARSELAVGCYTSICPNLFRISVKKYLTTIVNVLNKDLNLELGPKHKIVIKAFSADFYELALSTVAKAIAHPSWNSLPFSINYEELKLKENEEIKRLEDRENQIANILAEAENLNTCYETIRISLFHHRYEKEMRPEQVLHLLKTKVRKVNKTMMACFNFAFRN